MIANYVNCDKLDILFLLHIPEAARRFYNHAQANSNTRETVFFLSSLMSVLIGRQLDQP